MVESFDAAPDDGGVARSSIEAAENPGAATELPPEAPPQVVTQQPKASFWEAT